jgi:hypothetical protein
MGIEAQSAARAARVGTTGTTALLDSAVGKAGRPPKYAITDQGTTTYAYFFLTERSLSIRSLSCP